MKFSILNNNDGFVALISAMLMAAVLLTLAANAGRASYWARFGSLDYENKKIALAAARGCVDQALLGIAKDESVILWNRCQDLQIVAGYPYEIIARANWKNSFAELRVKAQKTSEGKVEIIEWREI